VARPYPELMPDTPEIAPGLPRLVRSPNHLDLYIDEGRKFDLGGDVTLEAFSTPGHMLNDNRVAGNLHPTLIGGDANHRHATGRTSTCT